MIDFLTARPRAFALRSGGNELHPGLSQGVNPAKAIAEIKQMMVERRV